VINKNSRLDRQPTIGLLKTDLTGKHESSNFGGNLDGVMPVV